MWILRAASFLITGQSLLFVALLCSNSYRFGRFRNNFCGSFMNCFSYFIIKLYYRGTSTQPNLCKINLVSIWTVTSIKSYLWMLQTIYEEYSLKFLKLWKSFEMKCSLEVFCLFLYICFNSIFENEKLPKR